MRNHNRERFNTKKNDEPTKKSQEYVDKKQEQTGNRSAGNENGGTAAKEGEGQETVLYVDAPSLQEGTVRAKEQDDAGADGPPIESIRESDGSGESETTTDKEQHASPLNGSELENKLPTEVSQEPVNNDEKKNNNSSLTEENNSEETKKTMGKNTNVRIDGNIFDNINTELDYNIKKGLPNQTFKAVVLNRLERSSFDKDTPPQYTKNVYNGKKTPGSIFVSDEVIININREMEYHVVNKDLYNDFSKIVNARLFATMFQFTE
jgi:hypothetical protein